MECDVSFGLQPHADHGDIDVKCPYCGGTGEIENTALAVAHQPFSLPPSLSNSGLKRPLFSQVARPDQVDRILSTISRLDRRIKDKEYTAKKALTTLRQYLNFILSREQVTSEELLEFFPRHGQSKLTDLSGFHKTIRALCRAVHKELIFEALVEKRSFQGQTFWKVTDFGGTVAKESTVIDV